MKQVRIGVVAPKSTWGEEEHRNAVAAVAYASEAAENGAELILFPEGYPGPCSGPMDSCRQLPKAPIEMMCECAENHGVYISCGNLEESTTVKGAYYLCHKLISPQGMILANYRRCQPTSPILNNYLYNGRKHILPGNQFEVVETKFAKIGLIICSELWVPEIARIEMLMGAQIILDPIGGSHSIYSAQPLGANGVSLRGSKMGIWRCLAQARAAENIVYVAGTSNIFFNGSPFGSFIAGPEGLIVTSDDEGIIYATLDMERLMYLRKSFDEADLEPPPDNLNNYKPILCQPGQNRDRRPELYSKLVEPQPDAFDFFYHTRGNHFFLEQP